jgi:hypothetical protein
MQTIPAIREITAIGNARAIAGGARRLWVGAAAK